MLPVQVQPTHSALPSSEWQKLALEIQALITIKQQHINLNPLDGTAATQLSVLKMVRIFEQIVYGHFLQLLNLVTTGAMNAADLNKTREQVRQMFLSSNALQSTIVPSLSSVQTSITPGNLSNVSGVFPNTPSNVFSNPNIPVVISNDPLQLQQQNLLTSQLSALAESLLSTQQQQQHLLQRKSPTPEIRAPIDTSQKLASAQNVLKASHVNQLGKILLTMEDLTM